MHLKISTHTGRVTRASPGCAACKQSLANYYDKAVWRGGVARARRWVRPAEFKEDRWGHRPFLAR